MPEPLAGRLAVTGSAGRLHHGIAFAGAEPIAHAHFRALPQSLAANRAPHARPGACSIARPSAGPRTLALA